MKFGILLGGVVVLGVTIGLAMPASGPRANEGANPLPPIFKPVVAPHTKQPVAPSFVNHRRVVHRSPEFVYEELLGEFRPEAERAQKGSKVVTGSVRLSAEPSRLVLFEAEFLQGGHIAYRFLLAPHRDGTSVTASVELDGVSKPDALEGMSAADVEEKIAELIDRIERKGRPSSNRSSAYDGPSRAAEMARGDALLAKAVRDADTYQAKMNALKAQAKANQAHMRASGF